MPTVEFDEEKHIYTVDGVQMPSVTNILSPITADHYGTINPTVLDMAARKGTEIHEALEELDLTGECEICGATEQYIGAYTEFLSEYRPTWHWVEKTVYAQEFGYCGTIDRAGKMLGTECVLDLKTTASPTKDNYIAYCCQTYAYALALRCEEADRYILFLRKDGTYRLMDCKEWEKKHGLDSKKLFMDCLNLKKYIGGIKGGK